MLKFVQLPARYRLWRPEHLRLVGRDLLRAQPAPVAEHREHLEAVIGWLTRAQDRRDGQPDAGGVSAGWSFEDGWLPSYPETSGYIVESFIAAARILDRPELMERAGRILDWELSIQNPDGSYPGHFGEPGSKPVIFNTGQIMHGMVAGYMELGREECLESAVRAAQWMLAQQDSDGCWRRSVHNDIPHTYNARSAWALLRIGELADEPRFTQAAVRNLDWALKQVSPSGWFRQNAFRNGETPFTHTIAYAMRGFLEVGLATGEARMVRAAASAARALAQAQRDDGWLAGEFDDGWESSAGYSCLTGVAQVALIWQRLRQSGVEADWQPHIDRALQFLKGQHRRFGNDKPDDGGIAGSLPIWGRYSRFEYPNWAAKFFADALMMEMVDEPVPAITAVLTSERHAEARSA